MLPKAYARIFAKSLIPNFAEKISIAGKNYSLNYGCMNSINNQDGELRETNFLSTRFEYTICSENLFIPFVLQLYKNIRGHYRLFAYTSGARMLSSLNLTTGYNDGVINLQIQLKLSTRNMIQKERSVLRDELVATLEAEGITILRNNIAYLGVFNPANGIFVDTCPEKLLLDFTKLSLIKGHFAKNKGYELELI